MNKILIAITLALGTSWVYAGNANGDNSSNQNGAIHHIGDGGGTVGEYTNDNTNQQQQGQLQGQAQGQASFNANDNSNSFNPTINVTSPQSVRPYANNINVTPASNPVSVNVTPASNPVTTTFNVPEGAFQTTSEGGQGGSSTNTNTNTPTAITGPSTATVGDTSATIGDTTSNSTVGDTTSTSSVGHTVSESLSNSNAYTESEGGDSNSSNELTINEADIPAITHSTYKYSGGYTVRSTPNVTAPSLTSSNGTCMGSSSVGGSGPGIGLSVGSTWVDDGCTRRYDSQMMYNMGYEQAALNIMCQSESVQKAAPELCGVEAEEKTKVSQPNETEWNGFYEW